MLTPSINHHTPTKQRPAPKSGAFFVLVCGVMEKKQIRNLAIIGLIGIALWQVSKRALRTITYAAGGFRVQKISFSEVEFRMELTVTNRSDVPAPITNFIGQLYYLFPNADPALPPTPGVLGELRQVAPVQLPGFGSAVVEFSMKSGLLGGAWQILNILTNGNPTNFGAINYHNVDMSRFIVDGTLKIGPLPIDIRTNLV